MFRPARWIIRPTRWDREILRLAVPALGALIAEPLYILADTAVVGHLGTTELAGLALASQVLLIIHALFIFLAYGTTAAVSRLVGAGDHREAAKQAVQGIWLAAVIGAVLGAVTFVFAEPLLRLLGGEGATLDNALIYLRVSLFGLPAMLMSLAGVGYLRGLQDTLRPLIVSLLTAAGNLILELALIYGLGFDIGASAFATVVAQWVGAALYVWWTHQAVTSHGVNLVPDPSKIGRLAVTGADLFVRTASLRGSFVVATAVAARMGDVELAAHQIAFELWNFVALALDAVAIAGQAMIGTFLGSNRSVEARAVGNRITQLGLQLGIFFLVVVLVARPWLPTVFSDDPDVVALTTFLFLFLALMAPVNGVVFALDGILIGAGDLRYLAIAMAISAAVFVPLAIAVGVSGAGIGWLWGALIVFMLVRMLTVLVRFVGDRWIVTGAVR